MSSVVGLELPNAWRTGQANDSNFDISANQLNETLSRQLWIPSSTIDWVGTRMANLAEPISAQDAATKNYVDLNGANLWSTFNAIQNVNMDSFKIINLAEPTLLTDAATKNYVDNNLGATQLDELTDVAFPIAPTNGQFLSFNSTSGDWENVDFAPGSPSSIVSPDLLTSVATFDGGPINFTVNGSLSAALTTTIFNVLKPVEMNNLKISNLGNPSADQDAATKKYVDDTIPTVIGTSTLDDLSDVTFDIAPIANQVMVHDGSLWRNQALAKAQLPNTIAYEDETNIFSQTQTFSSGLTVAANQNVNLAGAFMQNVRDATFNSQGTDPPDPILTDSTLFFGPGTDFNSADPLWQVLIDRGGVIEKKPVITSESIFALREFSNGMFTEETGVDLTAGTGTTIKVGLHNENNPGAAFEVVLGGQQHTIPDASTTPGTNNTFDMTEGTDITPALHYIWLQLDAGLPVMHEDPTGFPTNIDYAVVGKFLVQTQASVLADGAYAVLSPDYEIFDDVSRGHLAHINDRLTEIDAAYLEGIVLTTSPILNGTTTGAVSWSTTAGKAFELHVEDIEAFDSTLGTSISLVTNEGTQTPQQFTRVTDLSTGLQGLTLANGTTTIWQNNQRLNLVIYTIHNDDEPNQTNYGINLPVDAYSNDADAIADASNFAIKSISNSSRGLALLVAEIIISFTTSTTYTVVAIKDLRGQIPGAAASGGGAGGGATELNELSDVTIAGGPPGVALTVGQILEFAADSQWRNVDNPAGLLAGNNIWTGYQQYTPFAVGTGPTGTDGQFFTEVIDASNTGLFVNLNQAGVITTVRLA